MAVTNDVVIDTAAFYAMVSDGDAFHQRAVRTYSHLIDQGHTLWTTSYALVETIALTQRRLGYVTMSDFINRITADVSVIWIDAEIHNQTWERLAAHQGAGLSFVDWTIALAAERMEATIFTFDRGFASQGFSVMPSY